MPVISNCPECEHSVRLSDQWNDPSQKMRCPYCKAIYPLSKVLSQAKDQEDDEDSAIIEPAFDFSKFNPDAADEASEENPAPSFPSAAYDDEDEKSTSFPNFDGPSFGNSGGSSTAVATMESGVKLEVDEKDATPDTLAEAAVRRQERMKPNVMKQLGGIVGGGAAGIFIAYCLLLAYDPPRFNYLGLPIPWGYGDDNAQGAAFDEEAWEKASAKFSSDYYENDSTIKPVSSKNTTKTPVPEVFVDTEDVQDDFEVSSEQYQSIQGMFGGGAQEATPPKPIFQEEPTRFSADEVKTAYEKANASMAIPSFDGKGTNYLFQSQHFALLGDLAEKVTFPVSAAESISEETNARQMMMATFNDYAASDLLADQFQTAWSEQNEGGIAMAGIIQSVEPADEITVIKFIPDNSTIPVEVVTKTPTKLQRRKRYALLGVVYSEPNDKITAYSSSEEKVIWLGVAGEVKRMSRLISK
ncbi:Hypothetical protein PBC10988_15450 [Planctomycetales bacterium 10988]|nr:Hypothetical protein PBC10988_15450 [Planctomycetales bacterium 10988]